MKKKKQEKRTKKLRTLVLLLFLTIIMFGTSTYAWFTANRVVTINALDVQVSASNGIQVSTNAVDWKSVITNADITTNAYTGNVNQVPTEVTAVSTDLVPQTGGVLNMFSSVVDNDATSGAYTIKTVKETETAGTSGKFIVFDLFLRLDTPQTVYLTTDSDVVLTDSQAEDRGLKNAARIAFVNNGHTDATSSAATMIGLKGAGTVTMWEPNANSHSTLVTNSVAPEYKVTLGAESTPYRGIKEAFDTALPLISVVNGSNTDHSTAITPTIITPAVNATNGQYKTFAADLAAGVTKYRIYMWIEGQDIDCENNATGSNISFKLSLSTQNGASTQG